MRRLCRRLDNAPTNTVGGALARSPKEISCLTQSSSARVTLDCPNAGKLAAFYAEITGGQVAIPGDDWAMMTIPDGRDICFQAAPAYQPPAWPDPDSSMQMHLDFDVDDLNSTEARVLAAGAIKYELQPNDHCRVYADPVGHPFCLSTAQPSRSKPDRERNTPAGRGRVARATWDEQQAAGWELIYPAPPGDGRGGRCSPVILAAVSLRKKSSGPSKSGISR